MHVVGHVLWQTVAVLLMVSVLPVANAFVMSSTNYQLESDSINLGGGFSTSSSYQLESTVGEIATGRSDSASFSLRAGYQQMQEVYIALSIPSEVELLPALPGLTGGTATGSVPAHVMTDSAAGYSLRIQAEQSPAMQRGAEAIADYVPVGGVPDYNFIIGATDALFGVTVVGTDASLPFQAVGGVCGVSGAAEAWRCWDGLSTTPLEIATAGSSNHPVGATTTLQFQVGIGGNASVLPGEYVATTTVTALAL